MKLSEKNVETPQEHPHIEKKRSLQRKISRIIMGTKDRFVALITVDDVNMLPWFYKWIPATVLAISFAATGAHYKKEQELLIKELQTECATGTSNIEKQIVQNIKSYEQVMLGMRGLFEQEQPVTKEIFENYISSLDLEKNFYGIQEVHFTELERGNEKKKYKQLIERNQPLGNRMQPEEKREYSLSSLYSKSFGEVVYDEKTEKDIYGLDLILYHKNSELYDSFITTRNAAMDQARDTGKMTISDITFSTTGPTQDIQEKHFHIYMPIYRYNATLKTIEDRKKQIIGYIDTSFLVSKFIEKIVPKNKNIEVELYDDNQLLQENQFYNSPDLNSYNPVFTSVESIDIGGHIWKLQLKLLSNFGGKYGVRGMSNTIQNGILGSLLVSMLLLVAIRSRVKDLLVIKRERELKDQAYILNQELEDTLGNLSNYVNALNMHASISRNGLDGKFIEINQKFCELSQYSYNELIGKSDEMFKTEMHTPELYQEIRARITSGQDWRGELCNKAKDGSLYWVDTYIIPQKNSLDVVTGYMTIRIDITERKKAEAKMQELASYDILTGLPNRNLMMDRLNQAILFSDRNSTQGAVLFMDLDKFKIVNDTFGHLTGDTLLKEVTKRVKSVVRDSDTVARYGGDEFVIILPEITDSENAQVVGQKLINRVSEAFFIDGHEVHIGASIGISIFPNDGINSEVLLKNSDIAMYHAKESGRGKFQFFNETLNQAIEKQEFTLHYQPA